MDTENALGRARLRPSRKPLASGGSAGASPSQLPRRRSMLE